MGSFVAFHPRYLLVGALLAGPLLFAVSVKALQASPSEELAAAIQIAGPTENIASERTFLRAWRAVIVAAKVSSARAYVSEAVRLRPASASAVVESALSVFVPPRKQRLTQREIGIIREIVAGALLAEPKRAAAVVAAAVFVQPFARDEIVAAAILAAPEERYAITQAADSTSSTLTWIMLAENSSDHSVAAFGSLNPANIDTRADRDDKKVRSPEKKPKKPEDP